MGFCRICVIHLYDLIVRLTEHFTVLKAFILPRAPWIGKIQLSHYIDVELRHRGATSHMAKQGIEHSFPKSQVVTLTTVATYSLHQNEWLSQRPCTASPSVYINLWAPSQTRESATSRGQSRSVREVPRLLQFLAHDWSSALGPTGKE